MLIPWNHQETADAREKRLFLSRLKKAKHLNARVKEFIRDVKNSKMKTSEKMAILNELNIEK